MIEFELDKMDGIKILGELLHQWGPDEKPLDPEIFAWSAFQLGKTLDDEFMLEKAEKVARKNNYGTLLRKLEEVRTCKDEDKSSPTPSKIGASLMMWLIWIAWFLFLIADAGAKSAVKYSVFLYQ